jgi:hypothetical protein
MYLHARIAHLDFKMKLRSLQTLFCLAIMSYLSNIIDLVEMELPYGPSQTARIFALMFAHIMAIANLSLTLQALYLMLVAWLSYTLACLATTVVLRGILLNHLDLALAFFAVFLRIVPTSLM